MTQTIFALATAPGRAALAVVRISGPAAGEVLTRLAGRKFKPRRATLTTLRDEGGAVLDRALVIWFPGPRSYTGEDCAELHLHGGPGVVDGVTQTLLNYGPRLAEAGEFTRRAFTHGKLDLDQAEAIGDLVDAETLAQTRQALGQLGGRLGARFRHWRNTLIDALAQLEAAVDFPDEEMPPDVALRARLGLEGLISDLDVALEQEKRGQRVREGYRVAIIGAPNAGKSRLLNTLVGRDAAIVTAIPGATRDVIEAPLVLSGYQVILADMAGLREAEEPVEIEGVRRARAWAAAADLRLWLVDQAEILGHWKMALDLVRPGDICILNKSDLAPGADGAAARVASRTMGLEVLELSLLNADVSQISAALTRRILGDLAGADFPAATRARHGDLLRDAREHLARALARLAEPELAAEDARLAARALGRITGRIDAEDVLGRVFATFCIGK
jgi:tRNA modification GTPase